MAQSDHGKSGLDDAVSKYLGADTHPLWRLLDPVMESLPDQGVEKKTPNEQDRKKRKHEDDEETSEGRAEKVKKGAPKKRCLVCGQKHHPLCELTKEVRARLKAEAKAKKAENKKKRDAGKTDAKDSRK